MLCGLLLLELFFFPLYILLRYWLNFPAVFFEDLTLAKQMLMKVGRSVSFSLPF